MEHDRAELERRLMECEDLLVDLWTISAFESIDADGQKKFIAGSLPELKDTFSYLQLHARINANGVPTP